MQPAAPDDTVRVSNQCVFALTFNPGRPSPVAFGAELCVQLMAAIGIDPCVRTEGSSHVAHPYRELAKHAVISDSASRLVQQGRDAAEAIDNGISNASIFCERHRRTSFRKNWDVRLGHDSDHAWATFNNAIKSLTVAQIRAPLPASGPSNSEASLAQRFRHILLRAAAHTCFRYGYIDLGDLFALLRPDHSCNAPNNWEGRLANHWWQEYGIFDPARARGVFWANAYGSEMGRKLRAAGIEQLITDGIHDLNYDEGERPQLHWGPDDSLVVLLDNKPLEFARRRDAIQVPETALLVAVRLREALSRAGLL